jgi:hypothetical protein
MIRQLSLPGAPSFPAGLLGMAGMLIVLAACTKQRAQTRFSAITVANTQAYYNSFQEYCKIDSAANFESNAVVSNFFGDHRNAIAYATKRAANDKRQPGLQGSEAELDRIRKQFEASANDPGATADARVQARRALALLNAHTSVEEAFKDKSPRNARDFIVEQAKRYHFLLVNEAHYSSQNRAFTRSLLKPLWKQGYRYLALEALGYPDTSLARRGYPLVRTGFYIQDPVFGNLVREALAIGYTLVTYETTQRHDGTARDREQALNIYRNTWQKDKAGKVLVHAGYGHINEKGSPWVPMGAQLKELVGQDLLTVDQQVMLGLTEAQQANPYYTYAISHFDLREPVVFGGNYGQVLIDPMLTDYLDVQVYHPITTYTKGRPGWLITEGVRLVELPQAFARYPGYLLQAAPAKESHDTVPVDQFVIGTGDALVLPPGSYELRIIDCQGALRGKAQLRVK